MNQPVSLHRTKPLAAHTAKAAPSPHHNWSLDLLRAAGSLDLESFSANSTVASRPRPPTTSRETVLFSTFARPASASARTVGQSRSVDAVWVSSGPAVFSQARTVVMKSALRA